VGECFARQAERDESGGRMKRACQRHYAHSLQPACIFSCHDLLCASDHTAVCSRALQIGNLGLVAILSPRDLGIAVLILHLRKDR
jgi:hypothetical protein